MKTAESLSIYCSKLRFAKVLILTLGAFLTTGPLQAIAQELRSDSDAIAKDFAVACELSKFALGLGKTAAFRDQKPDLAYRVAEIVSGAFKTHEVKDAYRAIAAAAPEDRVKLWYESAKENGVKNFKCPTIAFK